MRVGVQLPEAERNVRWTEVAEMCRIVEAEGFDSIWVGDHLLYRMAMTEQAQEGVRLAESPHEPYTDVAGPWEAWSQLAAIAAITSRVEIGPLVASTSFHVPPMLAKKAAAVDEISDGRLVLGLGAGWHQPEYRAFGFPYDRRVSRFEEAFEIIRRLLAGEEVTYRGSFYSIERSVILPGSNRDGHIPLMIGSNGPRMLEATLPWVDRWNSWHTDFDNRAANLAPLVELVDRACEAVDRDPADVERSVALMLQFSESLAFERSSNPLRGSAEELAAELQACAGAGIDEVQLVLDPITIPSIEAAAEVLRAFRA